MTPTQPTFTQEADGTYHCPDCDKAFTRPQGISRHWNQQHAAFTGDDPGLDDIWPDGQPHQDVDDIHRTLYPEQYDQDGNPLADDDQHTDQTPPAEAHDHQDHPTLGADDTGVEEPGGQVEAPPAPPCPPGGHGPTVTLLTPAQVLDRATRARGEQLLDVAYALDILAGATARLVAVGMDPITAWEAITAQTQQHLTRGTAA